MPKFTIYFRGYCEIEGENSQDAYNKFCTLINDDKPLPSNFYDVWSVDSQAEDNEEKNRPRKRAVRTNVHNLFTILGIDKTSPL